MLKDILAIIEGGDQSVPAIDDAVALAELHGAHLGLTVLTKRLLLIAAFDPMGYCWPEPEREAEHAQHLADVRKRTARTTAPVDVRGLCDEPAVLPTLVNIEGRYADVVLVGPNPCWTDHRLRHHVVETTLLGSGAPMLLHPIGWIPAPVRHAILGWNASPEASRAARALIALAEPAARIDVLVIDAEPSANGHGPTPGSDIARHLTRHGFGVEVHARRSDGRPVSEVLQSFAVMAKADLLAIGAYAHSRFHEVLFGGVTRDLLETERVPILMVH
ncbi:MULTISPECIES: universal stress protein [Sphingomonadaceae]|uniref:universal stress protein n=1 Tax=Sphingomonadales TaxID=204457 RepID=UPI00076FE45B|nr:universal stress protein [Sphingobium sp. TKS]AMK22930.1 UspA domain-containing protein [Sphingobium sp. TKS]MCF8706669.1 universal stress protein [Rhizorhapis sp. SPR117]